MSSHLLRTILSVEFDALLCASVPVGLVAFLRRVLLGSWNGFGIYLTLDAWGGVVFVLFAIAMTRL